MVISWKKNRVSLGDLELYSIQLTEFSLLDLERIKDSIQKNGLLEPLNVTNDNIILDGRLRYEAVRELGWDDNKLIDVYQPIDKLKPKQVAECIIRFNNDIAGIDDNKKLRDLFTEKELLAGGYSPEYVSDIIKEPEDISINDEVKVFKFELTFDSEQQKTQCLELLSKLQDKTGEERFEDAVVSKIIEFKK